MSIWDVDAEAHAGLLVRRLEVEEGFLGGLNLAFEPGLNVLIGPRGSGKTSIIELIRFCLGLQPVSERAAKEARQHALSVLGSGRVTVTLDVDGDDVAISRSADSEVRQPPWARRVIVLGQGEIESVGIEPRGRVALLDAFRSADDGEAFLAAESTVRALTVEIRDLDFELIALKAQLSERTTASGALAEAERQVSPLRTPSSV